MSAPPPYWGQLPPPKVRRMSDDFDQSQSQPQTNRSNRASTQTAYTDASTESTFSPISPTSMSFRDTGLGPRPPSFSAAPPQQNPLPPELLEKRRRRNSQSQGQGPNQGQGRYSRDMAANSTPPVAPNGSRGGPPLGYQQQQQPYGNGGGPPYAYGASGPPPQTSYRPNSELLEGDSFYTTETPPTERYGKPPVLDRARQRFDEGDGSGNGNGNGNANANGSRNLSRDAPGSQSMRSTMSGMSGGGNRYGGGRAPTDVPPRRTSLGSNANRKMWADDRSPLQRLELTLDSITKEEKLEKRAVLEAAERRAREKAAAIAAGVAVDRGETEAAAGTGAGSGAGAGATRVARSGSVGGRQVRGPSERPSGSQQVRFSDTRQQQQQASPEQEENWRSIAADPVRAQPSAAATAASAATAAATATATANNPANTTAPTDTTTNTNTNTAQTEPSAALTPPPPVTGNGNGNGNRQYDLTGLSPRSRIATAINAYVEGSQQQQQQRVQVPPPQRNLSFRERAGQNDNDLDLLRDSIIERSPPPPAAALVPPPAPAPAPVPIPLPAPVERSVISPKSSRGSVPTRSGSNKLRKNPPGDPWHVMRRDAEERSAFSHQQPSATAAAAVPGGGGPERFHEAAAANVLRTKSMGGGTVRKVPAPNPNYASIPGGPPPPRREQFSGYDAPAASSNPQIRAINGPSINGPPPNVGIGRSNTLPAGRQPQPLPMPFAAPPLNVRPTGPASSGVRFAGIPDHDSEDDDEKANSNHRFRNYLHLHDKPKQEQKIYQKPQYLNEWEKATVGILSDSLLDLTSVYESSSDSPDEQNEQDAQNELSLTWWENSKRRGSVSQPPQPQPQPAPKPKPRSKKTIRAVQDPEDVDGRDTSFKPPLYLKCGPLLRYCGIRREGSEVPPPSHNNGASAAAAAAAATSREFWRGSVMIVTRDSDSSYEMAPTLRLFVQPIELLPPPPAELRGERLPEVYVDPIAGIPKIGRRGETLYVKPIESLEEAKDVSMLEPEEGLFEETLSPPNFDPKAPEPPLSFTSRTRRRQPDGQKMGKYRDVRGFRLHAERGYTFWRFNIEVELQAAQQQRIAYRINRGPSTAFWVPARGQSMNVMFHSCNGFSLSVNPDELTGPDPMWRDVLNTHQTRPFHVMLGGGDQIYNDAVMRETRHFQDWLRLRNPLHKDHAPFTADMQDELESFYLERYAMWFSRGLFGLATSQIPMVNMYDDHDIIDGFGSYPHHFMNSPVFSGLGNVAFKYYMLFQHQSLPVETERTEPSWCLGTKPGPYIKELSRSLLMSLGGNMALLAVDCRTERTQKEVVHEETWKSLIDRCYEEIKKNETQHLLVLLGVPIAYPRLVWLENILTSRLMEPVKALGRTGVLGNFLNHFDGSVEVLDDLDDHWTAKNHKDERRFVVEDLQDLAADKSCRVTILSGDVHLAAVGQFYSNPKLMLAKHRDFRYMPNVISSAVANAPPPDLMADVLNRRNKVHHFDKETDEDMIPLFANGVDGKPRNNKRLLPHRNWCSIRAYEPGYTPPPTPPSEQAEPDLGPDYDYEHDDDDDDDDEGGASPPPIPLAGGSRSRSRSRRGSFLRRFSRSRSRGPSVRPDVPREQQLQQQEQDPAGDRSRPPLSGGNFMRSLTMIGRRGSVSSEKGPRPNKLTRTRSLGAGGSSSSGRGFFSFRRSSIDQQQQPSPLRPPTRRRPDDGGINGTWGDSDEDDDEVEDIYGASPLPQQHQQHQHQHQHQQQQQYHISQQHLREIPRQQHPYPHHQVQHYQPQPQQQEHQMQMSLRGGAANPREVMNMEYEAGDDSYFQTAPRRAYTQPMPGAHRQDPNSYDDDDDDDNDDNASEISEIENKHQRVNPAPMPMAMKRAATAPGPGVFKRTPTGLSAKQLRKHAAELEVDLEGGLDVCLNVEVNPRDPAGITVPYRLLVPRLWYEEEVEEELGQGEEGGVRGGGLPAGGVGGGVGAGGVNPNSNANVNNNGSYISNPHQQQQQQQQQHPVDPNASSAIMSGGRGGAGYGDSNARLPQPQQSQPPSSEDMNIAVGFSPPPGPGPQRSNTTGKTERRNSISGGIKRWLSGRSSSKTRGSQQQQRAPPPPPRNDEYEDEDEDEDNNDIDDDDIDNEDDQISAAGAGALHDQWTRETDPQMRRAWGYR